MQKAKKSEQDSFVQKEAWGLSRSADRLRLGNGTKKMGKPVLGGLNSFEADKALLATTLEARGSRAILEAELLVGPDVLDLGSVRDSNTCAATFSDPLGSALETELLEHGVDALHQVSNLLGGVAGSGRDTKTLLANGDRRVVDALDVDLVLRKEHVRSFLREGRVADQHWHDVRRVGDDGDVKLSELTLDFASVELLEAAITLELALISDRGLGAGNNRRWKRSGEDKARCVRSDHVDKVGRTGDVATDDTVGLAESTGDDIDAVHHGALDRVSRRTGGLVRFVVEVLGDTSTVRAIHANSVDFIVESDGTVLVGKIADLLDGRDAATHRVDAFKSDDFGGLLGHGDELGLEIGHVVVPEDDLFGARVANALDHRGVVERIGEDDAARQLSTDGGKASVVGHVAR